MRGIDVRWRKWLHGAVLLLLFVGPVLLLPLVIPNLAPVQRFFGTMLILSMIPFNWVFMLIPLRRLRAFLHGRGYAQFGYTDAAHLFLELGPAIWRIPHADDLKVVPGAPCQHSGRLATWLLETADLMEKNP